MYGICYCPVSKNTDLKELGVDDSKALTEEQREKLLDKVLDNKDYLGWAVHVLSPRYGFVQSELGHSFKTKKT